MVYLVIEVFFFHFNFKNLQIYTTGPHSRKGLGLNVQNKSV